MPRGLFPVSLLVSGLLMVSVALGLGSSRPVSAQETSLEKGVTGTVESAIAAYNRGDLPALSRLFTDDAFQKEFFESKSDAASDPEFFSDQVELGGVRNITETETGATATVDFVSGLGVSSEELSFIFQGGIWVVSDSQPGEANVPEGTPIVDLALQDFAFVYDADAVAGGNFALNVTNMGDQDHEVVLIQLPEAMSVPDLIDTIASSDESGPPPFIDFGFLGVFTPGEMRTAALAHPLDDGYYAFICFLPDTDGTPHAFKGMVSTFTVGSPSAGEGGGTISPPNTGDAGLAAPGSGVNSGLMALGVLALVAGLFSGLRVVRR
jgi:hypothetical protein